MKENLVVLKINGDEIFNGGNIEFDLIDGYKPIQSW